MPLLKRLGLQSTVRASLAMYSAREDIDALIEAIRFARARFAK
jgi:selenocysteine lyase/cysteine desulfurase